LLEGVQEAKGEEEEEHGRCCWILELGEAGGI